MAQDQISDKEFRARLEDHFAIYRINLRQPVVSHIIPDAWYRADLLLVNELGLFRHADLGEDRSVVVTCAIRTATGHTLVPVELRGLNAQGEPGFCGSGKGGFEYRVRGRLDAPLYLLIQASSLSSLRHVVPLMVGPIQMTTADIHQHQPTFAPIEEWPENTPMVHDTYRMFSLSSQDDKDEGVIIQETWDAGIPGKIWDSALVMLQFIEKISVLRPELFQGKHVLDLSAGTGLLGLAMASMKHIKPEKITITELEEALPLIRHNMSLNNRQQHHAVYAKPLLWGSKVQAEKCGKADMIMASDVLYETEYFDDLVQALLDLSKKGTLIYIGYKRRGLDPAEENRFWSLCQANSQFGIALIDQHDPDALFVPKSAEDANVQIFRLVKT